MGIVMLILPGLDCHSDLQTLQKFSVINFLAFVSFTSV